MKSPSRLHIRDSFRLEKTVVSLSPTTCSVFLFFFLLFPGKQQHTSIILASEPCKSNENVHTGSQWVKNQHQNHSLYLCASLCEIAFYSPKEVRKTSTNNPILHIVITAPRIFDKSMWKNVGQR